MSTPTVSVVVVSRGRPNALLTCLTGLAQLDYPAFEIVVVADPAGIGAIEGSDFAGRIKTRAFDESNISAARNLGIALAAGEIAAFIDDDAVPEPTWLTHLAQPFEDAEVVAAGGFVRGRNGISFQNTARMVDRHGYHEVIDLPIGPPRTIAARPGLGVKTEGTNCAIRRSTLAELGGFDPAFHFYMDETDLNLRLAAKAAITALVPFAEVHHSFLASAQRTADRLPKTLHDIGASTQVFLRKHAPDEPKEPVLDDLRTEQRARLDRLLAQGLCEPREIGRLMQTLEAGIAEGATRQVAPLAPIPAPGVTFQRFAAAHPWAGMAVLAGRAWSAGPLRKEARERVAAGERISLFLFSPTTLYHQVRFHPDGYWEQRGGLFGRSDRSDPIFRPWSFKKRLEREKTRVASVRGFTVP